MKKFFLLTALCSIGLQAQEADKSDNLRPQNPILAALDANHDGEIDNNEINNAPAALRKLDKNSDGKLTRSELRAMRDPDKSGDKAAKAEKKAKKKKLE